MTKLCCMCGRKARTNINLKPKLNTDGNLDLGKKKKYQKVCLIIFILGNLDLGKKIRKSVVSSRQCETGSKTLVLV